MVALRYMDCGQRSFWVYNICFVDIIVEYKHDTTLLKFFLESDPMNGELDCKFRYLSGTAFSSAADHSLFNVKFDEL